MNDPVELSKAMLKDPKRWAEIFIENRRLLDCALTELQSLKAPGGPVQGCFSSSRAQSFILLIRFFIKQMASAYMQEKEFKANPDVFALSGAACKNHDLNVLQGLIKQAQEILSDFHVIRGMGDLNDLDSRLRANNPCKIVFSSTVNIADAEGIVHYQTPVEGLAITLTAVSHEMSNFSGAFSYRSFFSKWFSTDSMSTEKVSRACLEFSDPDAIVFRSTSSIISIARAIIVASYDSALDRQYIEKTFTLEAYVEASKYL